MKSSILSIGTELTDGQITNRNAAWLSARVKPLGFRPCLHLSVPDDHAQILEGLQWCADRSDLIFVTGGLGPTSDDFTRDMIATWAQSKMVFDPETWDYISNRLRSRGLVVHEFQKQQCFFPEGSVLLKNAIGTAHGFRLTAKGKDLVILPGPPREIESIWIDHLHPWLLEKGSTLEAYETQAWQLLGIGEAIIPTLVEPLVQGQNLEVGYRVHLPYVEFKITYRRSEASRIKDLIHRLNTALAPWTVLRNEEDLAHRFSEKLHSFSQVVISDQVTGNELTKRLAPHLMKPDGHQQITFQNHPTFLSGEATLFLGMQPVDENKINISLRGPAGSFEETLTSPYQGTTPTERRRLYFAEYAMIWWENKMTTKNI